MKTYAELLCEIAELREENERIRQTHVTHEVMCLLLDEKDAEIEELQSENERLKEKNDGLKELAEDNAHNYDLAVEDVEYLTKQLDAAIYRMQKLAIEIKWLRGEEGKA